MGVSLFSWDASLGRGTPPISIRGQHERVTFHPDSGSFLSSVCRILGHVLVCGGVKKRATQASLGCFSRSPSGALLPFFGEGSPTKIDYRKKGILILTSPLEDSIGYYHPVVHCTF